MQQGPAASTDPGQKCAGRFSLTAGLLYVLVPFMSAALKLPTPTPEPDPPRAGADMPRRPLGRPASASTGTRAPTSCSSTPPRRRFNSAGVEQGRRRRVLARHRDVGHVRAWRWRDRSSSQNKPVTHVENFCATGSEALRNAAYAVASGAYDSAMAIGVEKVKDSGYQGLVGAGKTPTDGTGRTLTAAAMFAMCAPAYAKKYGVDDEEMREVLARIACEEPLQRRPEPARAVPPRGLRSRRSAPSPLDGRRPRRLRLLGRRRRLARRRSSCRAEDAHKYTDTPLYIKALSFVAGNCSGQRRPRLRLHHVPRDRGRAEDAYAQAGVTDPRGEIAMAEVHDCFTPAELAAHRGPRVRRARHARGRKCSPARSISTATCP